MTAPVPAGSSNTLLPIATGRRVRAAIGELLRGRRLQLTATVVVLLGAGVAIAAVPALLGRMVDLVLANSPRANSAAADTSRQGLDLLALALLSVLLLRAVLAGLGHVLVARLGETVLARLRERVLGRALETPLATVERAGSGDLIQRTGGDIGVISEGIRTALPAMTSALLDVALTLVGLTLLDWRLGLAGLAPLPIWIFATRWYLRVSGPRYAAERVADGRQSQSLISSITGAATIRAYRSQRQHLDGLRRTSADSVTAGMSAATTSARYGFALNCAEMVGVLSILVAGALLVRGDLVTIGAATAAALYFLRLFSPLMSLLYLLDEAQAAGAALARLVGVADLPAPPVPATPRTPVDASVSITGVSFAYDDGPEVLHGLDLQVTAGERLAVVGASGAGKTTLGSIVAGIHSPLAGDVRIGGVALSDLAEVRRSVVLVTQEVHLFAGTVADNLRLARGDASDDDLRTVLAQLGVNVELDVEVGAGAGEVGATLAQQLALARLLLADPAVVVLDEATAEAGSAGARVLELAAERALQGRTSIVIAHRLTQAVSADRVAVMDKGRLVEVGRHSDLITAGGRYAALWSAWSGARG